MPTEGDSSADSSLPSVAGSESQTRRAVSEMEQLAVREKVPEGTWLSRWGSSRTRALCHCTPSHARAHTAGMYVTSELVSGTGLG